MPATAPSFGNDPTSLTVLERIEAPQCAVAESEQRLASATVVTPRGIRSRIHTSVPTSYSVPHQNSAMWFKEIYSGFVSAQDLEVAFDATRPLKMLASETTELTFAATKSIVADDSLPPRRVGLWLLSNPYGSHATSTELFLDALST